MELKHFSHSHGLVFHQVPQGSQIHCSACKSPGSGDVYACWQCNYFLHQQCFRATRSLNHPSHPLHPLTLALSPTYPSGSFICNSCSLTGDGLSYSCSACDFDIHVHCALIPNPISPVPRSIDSSVYPPPNITDPIPPPVESKDPDSETSMIKHFSHPHLLKPNEIEEEGEDCSACDSDLSGSAYSCTIPRCSFNLHKACFDLPRKVRHKFHPHTLTLLADVYTCDACQNVGKAFVYNCATCSYDLHIDCVRLPESVSRPDHDHPLSLSTPVSDRFLCDVCNILVNENAWVYYCSKCDFGTHLECVHSEIEKENVSDEEEEEETEIEQENASKEEEEEKEEGEEEEEEEGDLAAQLIKSQQQYEHSVIRLRMAQQNAQFVNSIANSFRTFM